VIRPSRPCDLQVAGEIRFSSVKPVGNDRIQFNGAVFVVPGAGGVFNASHRVERLRFGPALPDLETAANPLSGVAKLSEKGEWVPPPSPHPHVTLTPD
jgi:hypothetical protein